MPITDPKAIRALAHPLRLDLLELLVAISPTTAAHCGRILGTSQANCSFHLRQLAKYGFVEDAGPGPDRRERQWRVPDPVPTLRITPVRSAADGDALEGGAVRQQLERVVVERAARAIVDFSQRRQAEDPDWAAAASVMTAVAMLSAEEAVELKEKWKALLEPYLVRNGTSAAPGQRYLRYFMAATPLQTSTPDEGETS